MRRNEEFKCWIVGKEILDDEGSDVLFVEFDLDDGFDDGDRRILC